MPTPTNRTPIRLARGTYSNLNASIADILDGEMVYATDQDKFYVKDSGALVAIYLTAADIGVTVQGYDSTILKSSDIGTSIQGYDADLAAVAALSSTGLINRTGTGTAATVSVPAGDLVGTSATQTLTNKTLTSPELGGTAYVNGSYRANVVAVPSLDIDCSSGNYFTKTINGNSTFTVSNVPSSRAYSFTLELTHTSGTITWFSGVEWPSGNAPTLTTGKTHVFIFITDDGGSRWRGAALTNYTN